ncbi:flotillin [Longispora fulva]|uniref:Flotillin n=1 Tax=Longispora fulva TaxID=619741 RepID=A0A8J7KSH7_9ACTN|nr:SPFH domain-containing protein [Longispora fulva]MBG6139647.1 flotillin [Longispora fulva]GIG57971.1 flotillin [Longispora fulva]
MSSILFAIIGGALLLLLIVLFVLSRIKVAGPNEAFIVTGRKGKATTAADGTVVTDMSGQKVVMGASVFVMPVVQRLYILDLSSREIPVSITGAVSKQGIRCDADAVAIVKVGGTAEAIRPAAQRFLHQQDKIAAFTAQVLAGALRSIVGRLTVEEIIRDRAAFAAEVAEEVENTLSHQGLVLDAFQLEDIRTAGSYLQDLGRPEAARVLQTAAIAEAQARQAAEQARMRAEELIAEANRNLALKQAEVQSEIDAAKARSAAAGPLAEAERQQAILMEQQKVAERNAELKERELNTEVRKPADAARYKLEQEAEAARNAAVFQADAQRQAAVARAQAEAETARLNGEGEKSRRTALAEANAIEGAKEGEAEKLRRQAIADAVEREGAAEASAILAKGQAEAEAMEKKAEAFARYGEAAILDLLVKVLPQVVKEASAPMASIDKLTVISTDGASSLTKSVASNVAQGLQLGTDLTGIDLAGLLAKLGGAAADTKVLDAE